MSTLQLETKDYNTLSNLILLTNHTNIFAAVTTLKIDYSVVAISYCRVHCVLYFDIQMHTHTPLSNTLCWSPRKINDVRIDAAESSAKALPLFPYFRVRRPRSRNKTLKSRQKRRLTKRSLRGAP